MGFGDAIRNGVDVNGDVVSTHSITKTDPILYMIQGDRGFSFNPLKLLGSYKRDMLKKMMQQSKEVLETPERNGESWKDDFLNEKAGCLF